MEDQYFIDKLESYYELFSSCDNITPVPAQMSNGFTHTRFSLTSFPAVSKRFVT